APAAMEDTPAAAWDPAFAIRFGSMAILTHIFLLLSQKAAVKECPHGGQEFQKSKFGNWSPTSSRSVLPRNRTRRMFHPSLKSKRQAANDLEIQDRRFTEPPTWLCGLSDATIHNGAGRTSIGTDQPPSVGRPDFVLRNRVHHVGSVGLGCHAPPRHTRLPRTLGRWRWAIVGSDRRIHHPIHRSVFPVRFRLGKHGRLPGSRRNGETGNPSRGTPVVVGN